MNKLKGLFVFSITNMLERFGFFAMMSVVLFSLTRDKGYGNIEAGYYYSIFYAAIYISMFIMGLAGDFFNRRKVIYTGLALMTLGYFLYSIIYKGSGIPLIIPGILFILGVGAFKTNLQVQVGDLYKNNISNGASGYIIFYAFINLGAILAPPAAIYLKKAYGINSVFLLCGATTLLALALYYFVPVTSGTENKAPAQEGNTTGNGTVSAATLPANKSTGNSRYGTDQLIGLVFLVLFVPIFWIAFHQNAFIYTLFVRDHIELSGHSTDTVLAVNPLASVLLSVIVLIAIYFWVKIKNIHSIFPIIGTGIFIVALGYFIPVYGLANLPGKLPFGYAIIPMIILTLGEVFVTPFLTLGFYHFSPARFRGIFMGLFLFISAAGNMLLYKYANIYHAYGALYTFQRIIIHVLISAVAVYIVWFLIRKLNARKK